MVERHIEVRRGARSREDRKAQIEAMADHRRVKSWGNNEFGTSLSGLVNLIDREHSSSPNTEPPLRDHRANGLLGYCRAKGDFGNRQSAGNQCLGQWYCQVALFESNHWNQSMLRNYFGRGGCHGVFVKGGFLQTSGWGGVG